MYIQWFLPLTDINLQTYIPFYSWLQKLLLCCFAVLLYCGFNGTSRIEPITCYIKRCSCEEHVISFLLSLSFLRKDGGGKTQVQIRWFCSLHVYVQSRTFMDQDSSQWCPGIEQEAIGTHWTQKVLSKHKKNKIQHEDDQSITQVAQRSCWMFLVGVQKYLIGHSFEWPPLADPAWAGSLD